MKLTERHINHITAWQASALNQADYCKQQGLNAKTFSRWVKCYQAFAAPVLIPIKVSDVPQSPTFDPIRLRLRNEMHLELPASVSSAWVAELLQCLN